MLNGYGSALQKSIDRMSEIKKRSFAAAAYSRLTADWNTLARTVNYDIRMGGAAMRARARDLAQNDPYAKKFLRMIRKNVVGSAGFTFRNKAGEYSKKGNNFEWVMDNYANKVIQDQFWYWGDKRHATITGNVSFRELCGLAVQQVAMDGELFIKHVKGKKVNDFGYTLQIIDADFIAENLNTKLSNGNYILMGIEFTPERKPVNYYFIAHDLDSEMNLTYLAGAYYQKVPASEVTHLFLRESANQVRGFTWFAPTAVRIKMLQMFEEAALSRSVASAKVPWMLEKGETGNPKIVADKESAGDQIEELEDGEIYRIPDGFKVHQLNPDYPHAMHGEFDKTILKGISAGQDVSYHTLASDYLGVSWTSSRTALLDERDGWKNLQSWFIEHFLNDVVYHFLEMALLSGKINLPFEKFEKFYAPTFIGRRWDWVDPEAEVNANIKAKASLQKTLEEILAERGLDLEETLEQHAREDQLIKKYGLSLTLDPKSQPKKPEENVTAPAKNYEFVPANGNGRH